MIADLGVDVDRKQPRARVLRLGIRFARAGRLHGQAFSDCLVGPPREHAEALRSGRRLADRPADPRDQPPLFEWVGGNVRLDVEQDDHLELRLAQQGVDQRRRRSRRW